MNVHSFIGLCIFFVNMFYVVFDHAGELILRNSLVEALDCEEKDYSAN
jgi:hypothetical protein